jgi:O-methyltransferase
MNSCGFYPLQRRAYLHLLKRTLTRSAIFPQDWLLLRELRGLDPLLLAEIQKWISNGAAAAATAPSPGVRAVGLDWPADADTMIGLARLNNLEYCVLSALERDVPGDLVETGVWRGGATIFMRAILRAYGDNRRVVWVADSFQGLPKPDADAYPQDKDNDLWTYPQLAVSADEVREKFRRYGLLDDRVRFLEGWFRDTLPDAAIERISVLRLDGDMYESTIVALETLYGKLSPGGYVIVDDFGSVPACRRAVQDFRADYGIDEAIIPVDWTGVYWQVMQGRPAGETSRSFAKPGGRRGVRRTSDAADQWTLLAGRD